MAKSAKPTYIPEWARNDTTDPVLGTANVVEPSEAKKDGGWDPYEKPPRNWINWLQRGAHLWIDYFNQYFTATHQLKIDEILEETSAAGVTIDGVVCKDGGVTASGTVVTNTIAELGTASGVTIDGVLCKDSAITAGIVELGTGAGVMHTKIINIGDWNMNTNDATAAPAIAHGLTATKIRSVSVIIQSDAGVPYDLRGGTGGSTQALVAAQGNFQINATNVLLYRLSAGTFDSTDFNQTSFNRGWITIDYID